MKVSEAERVPVADGVKLMLTEQLAEPARLEPQVLAAMVKSEALAPEMAMLAILIGAAPPLVSVTDCSELVEPTAIAVKVNVPGSTLAFAARPVPDNITVCGLFAAESLNVRMALRAPAPDGVKATLTVQFEEEARAVPQVVPSTTKSVEFTPVMEVLIFEIPVAPLLRSVIVCARLVEPRVVAPNESDEGFTAAVLAGTMPVPDRKSVAGEWLELSVKITLAWRIPAAVGAKINVAVQLDPAARVVPQVLLTIEKSPGLAPEIEMLRMLIADEPPFVSFTVCEAPSEPTATFCHDTLVGLTNTATTETQPVKYKAQARRNTLNQSAPAVVSGRAVDQSFTDLGINCTPSASEKSKRTDEPIVRLADTQGRNLHSGSIVGIAIPFTDVLRTY